MQFNSIFPVLWIVIASIIALVILFWLEIKRNQKFLVARLIAISLSIFSIVCLMVRPSLPVSASKTIKLLTPGYKKALLDSLTENDPQSLVLRLSDEASNAKKIINYRSLSDLKGNLFILGDGFPEYMLEYINSPVKFFPSAKPEGFTFINQANIFTARQSSKIEGIINIKSPIKLALSGPGIDEDSINIQKTGQHSFSLKFTPKTAGEFIYSLTASDSSGKVIASENIPVQVKKEKSLSILVLTDYPSAEIRFLKNFLAEENHKLSLRYKISKDKFRNEFVNTPQKSITRLNEVTIKNYDLIITDISTLTSLSGDEIRTLKESIKLELGVLILINTSEIPERARDFMNLKTGKVKSDSASFVINEKKIKTPASPISILSDHKLFPIQKESSGRVISGYKQSGLGKSGFQLLTHTFNIQLSGQKELYAQLWSPLLETIARKEMKKYDLTFTTPFPYYQDEPVGFTIIATAEKPYVTTDSAEVPLQEDPLIKNLWHGKLWAGTPGWQSLFIKQDSSEHHFFVSENKTWKTVQIFNQHRSLQKLSASQENFTSQTIQQPVPPLIFFLLFLIATGFLWLAPKL